MGKGKKPAKRKKATTVKDLTVTDAKAVRGGGKVATQEFHFTQTVNKATP
jgi:type VI protein secretion system component Hcp